MMTYSTKQKTALFALAGMAALLAGCSGTAEPNVNHTNTSSKNNTHMNTTEYNMVLSTDPTPIVPGHETVLRLTPTRPVPLELSHEKKIHLIVVSEDLSYFNHIHPTEDSGSYRVSTTFPHSGKFYLFADYVPLGGEQTVNRLELTVQGKAPMPQHYATEKLTGQSGPYSLTLVPDGKLQSGHMAIDGILSKNNRPVDPATLDNYLGAKAHVVLIGVQNKEYLHVHPEVAEGRYKLHTSFPEAGIYRGWIQFMANGQLHSTDYVLVVEPNKNTSEEMEHGHH